MNHDVCATVGSRFNQVFSWNAWQVADFSQFLNCQLLITFWRIQTGTDCSSAQVHFQQQFCGAQQVAGFFIQQHVESVEFLAQRHWYGVL